MWDQQQLQQMQNPQLHVVYGPGLHFVHLQRQAHQQCLLVCMLTTAVKAAAKANAGACHVRLQDDRLQAACHVGMHSDLRTN